MIKIGSAFQEQISFTSAHSKQKQTRRMRHPHHKELSKCVGFFLILSLSAQPVLKCLGISR